MKKRKKWIVLTGITMIILLASLIICFLKNTTDKLNELKTSEVESIVRVSTLDEMNDDDVYQFSEKEMKAFLKLLKRVELGNKVKTKNVMTNETVFYYKITVPKENELVLSPGEFFMVDEECYVFKNHDELWNEFVKFNNLEEVIDDNKDSDDEELKNNETVSGDKDVSNNENESDNEITSKNEQSEDEKQETTSNVPEKTPEKPQGCQHTYSKQVTEQSCTSDGYTQYTCTKCGDSYKADVIKAGHEYGKYICINCGSFDPQSSKFWAMNAWLKTYGELNSAGTMYICNGYDNTISISSHLSSDSFYINYYNEATQEQFMVWLNNTNTCRVNYALGRTRGSFTISSAYLSSAYNVVFEEFYTPEDEPMNEEYVAAECKKVIDKYMFRAQNEILSPKIGMKLRDFGFTSY